MYDRVRNIFFKINAPFWIWTRNFKSEKFKLKHHQTHLRSVTLIRIILLLIYLVYLIGRKVEISKYVPYHT